MAEQVSGIIEAVEGGQGHLETIRSRFIHLGRTLERFFSGNWEDLLKKGATDKEIREAIRKMISGSRPMFRKMLEETVKQFGPDFGDELAKMLGEALPEDTDISMLRAFAKEIIDDFGGLAGVMNIHETEKMKKAQEDLKNHTQAIADEFAKMHIDTQIFSALDTLTTAFGEATAAMRSNISTYYDLANSLGKLELPDVPTEIDIEVAEASVLRGDLGEIFKLLGDSGLALGKISQQTLEVKGIIEDFMPSLLASDAFAEMQNRIQGGAANIKPIEMLTEFAQDFLKQMGDVSPEIRTLILQAAEVAGIQIQAALADDGIPNIPEIVDDVLKKTMQYAPEVTRNLVERWQEFLSLQLEQMNATTDAWSRKFQLKLSATDILTSDEMVNEYGHALQQLLLEALDKMDFKGGLDRPLSEMYDPLSDVGQIFRKVGTDLDYARSFMNAYLKQSEEYSKSLQELNQARFDETKDIDALTESHRKESLEMGYAQLAYQAWLKNLKEAKKGFDEMTIGGEELKKQWQDVNKLLQVDLPEQALDIAVETTKIFQTPQEAFASAIDRFVGGVDVLVQTISAQAAAALEETQAGGVDLSQRELRIENGQIVVQDNKLLELPKTDLSPQMSDTVSYTHLTLPTSDLV